MFKKLLGMSIVVSIIAIIGGTYYWNHYGVIHTTSTTCGTDGCVVTERYEYNEDGHVDTVATYEDGMQKIYYNGELIATLNKSK